MIRNTITALIFLASMAFAPAVFAAGECATDAECESYETCELVGQSDCACPPGDAGCDCPDGGAQDYYECVPEPPDPCDTDADCTGDLECVTQTYEQCSGGGSTGTCVVSPDGGTECEDAGSVDVTESCETITEGYCLPSYLGPCETGTDCGAGFACEPNEVCECTGGDSDGTADAGSSVGDSGDSCTCEQEGNYCQLIEVECTSDSDCSGDLTCQSYGDTATEPGAPCVGDGDASSCTSEDAGSSDTKYCLPPDWERWGESAGDYIGGGTDDGSNEEQGDAAIGSPDAGQSAASDDSSSGTSGGCSSTGGHAPLGGLALALFGLLGLALRRRR